MGALKDKNVVVVGGSRGVGRIIVEAAIAEGACVLAVARGQEALAQLSREVPEAATLVCDATEEGAPAVVFAALQPDVLVVCAGAIPPSTPVQEQSWIEFSVNWEADVKASFLFCKAALLQPLAPGALVILISSGAGLGGSPISGGYAGSKRMQMFLAGYTQKESDRLALGLRFLALAPGGIMPDTGVGDAAVAGYSRYLGISASDFVRRRADPPSPEDVARAVIGFADASRTADGAAFVVTGSGVAPLR
ncbi:SDR family oxidoreductase [Gloeobacter violaceus]|uniref:Gll1228 protein n=1 Tax=Gloeobacter violaceus (strain ATCC 29082 / PCC 7421) TaxID=251221 RepID=Q7NL98_GLOVI|nr:SDR family oxidoreductase [Gloeobacter violaceus]BAC89169.1 gll1228 [Gloeobacter violaceus PCC 7421]